MAENQKMRPTNISRRSVLQGVAFAVGATPIICDDVSCVGGEDVAGVGWLPKLPEGRPKLRELQAVRPTVLLHAR
jgi:hypothetical protein